MSHALRSMTHSALAIGAPLFMLDQTERIKWLTSFLQSNLPAPNAPDAEVCADICVVVS